MNKIFSLGVLLCVLTASMSSCKILKRKPGKKQKAKAALQARRADSLAQAAKADTAMNTGIVRNAVFEEVVPLVQPKVLPGTMSAKAKVHYEGGDKALDFNAIIRVKRDSIIWISVNVAGIVNVARAIVTPDSFKAILYTEKQAYTGPVSKAAQVLPAGIDFFSLQALILGNPIFSSGNVNAASLDSTHYSAKVVKDNYLEQLQFARQTKLLASDQLVSTSGANRSLLQVLEEYARVAETDFSHARNITVLDEGKNVTATMKFEQVQFNGEQSFPFSIPSNYEMK